MTKKIRRAYNRMLGKHESSDYKYTAEDISFLIGLYASILARIKIIDYNMAHVMRRDLMIRMFKLIQKDELDPIDGESDQI